MRKILMPNHIIVLISIVLPVLCFADYLEQANIEKNKGNFPLAVELLIKSADVDNNPEGCTILASLYIAGHLVDQDIEKGLMYYNKAIDSGWANAANNLGISYLNGEGVQKNWKKAIVLLEKAISLGSNAALYNIAQAYNPDLHPENTDVLAFQKKLLEAAEAGNVNAQYSLSLKMLGSKWKLKKQSTHDKIKEAYKWAKKARDNGSKEAKDVILLIQKQYGIK